MGDLVIITTTVKSHLKNPIRKQIDYDFDRLATTLSSNQICHITHRNIILRTMKEACSTLFGKICFQTTKVTTTTVATKMGHPIMEEVEANTIKDNNNITNTNSKFKASVMVKEHLLQDIIKQ